MNRKGSAALVIPLILLIIIAAAGAVWYYKTRQPIHPQSSTVVTPTTATSTLQNSTSTQIADTISSSSEGTVINDQYSLFILTPLGLGNCGTVSAINYYDGGMISSGPYSGYHRVIAAVPPCSPPGGYFAVIFATQDYQHFIIDPNSLAEIGTSTQESYFLYNPAKVTAVSINLPTDSPPLTIPLGNFVLVQRNDYNDIYYYGSTPTSSPLTSLVPGLTFYADSGQSAGMTQPAEDLSGLGNENDVLIKTSSGPLFDYILVSKEEFAAGSSTLDYANNGNVFFYRSTQISSTEPLYQTYGQIAVGTCGPLNITYLLNNISRSDLVQVGTTAGGVTLYAPKDSDSYLNHDEFNDKVIPWIEAGATTTDNGTPIPTYDNYVTKNPVLIFQDPWGRWTGLGEIDIPTMGGCG